MSAYDEYYITLLIPVTIESIKFKAKKNRDSLKLRFSYYGGQNGHSLLFFV